MKECIILAGGLGTRLGDIAAPNPKCLVKIIDKPFIHYLFNFLIDENFDHIILSLGYGANRISAWLETQKLPFSISVVVEKEQLGTGGAIRNAISAVKGDSTFVMNGDTLFRVNTEDMMSFHVKKEADVTIALKPMTDIERYGSVLLNENNKITSFKEKISLEKGLINGGVYVIDKTIFENIEKEIFSFEKEILEHTDEFRIYGDVEDSYFIDVGTPEDYQRANQDFINF